MYIYILPTTGRCKGPRPLPIFFFYHIYKYTMSSFFYIMCQNFGSGQNSTLMLCIFICKYQFSPRQASLLMLVLTPSAKLPVAYVYGHIDSHCNTLQPNATQVLTPSANLLYHMYTNICILIATHCNTLQHAATHCNTSAHVLCQLAVAYVYEHIYSHCNTLQHAATHCNTSAHVLYQHPHTRPFAIYICVYVYIYAMSIHIYIPILPLFYFIYFSSLCLTSFYFILQASWLTQILTPTANILRLDLSATGHLQVCCSMLQCVAARAAISPSFNMK